MLSWSINKQNYSDTIVAVPPDELRLLNIPIRYSKDKIERLADSVRTKIKAILGNQSIRAQDRKH